MATSDTADDHEAIAPPSSNVESAIVRQMAELADSIPLDESRSPSVIRDVADCVQLFSHATQWTRGSTGADSCGATADALEPLESVEATFVNSRFEIRRMLGHGGFGLVLLAFDKRLGREVALKVPRPEVLASRSFRERFLREAQVAAALDHPNIVPVYDTGELGPIWFITSRYINGPTLAEWIDQQSLPVSSRRAAELMTLLAGAVQHAHSRGVLHCDLKAANVLLEPSETQPDRQFLFVPRLSDFGLARHVNEANCSIAPNSLVGTPRYMAPEQAACRHNEVGIQTDVYGLGALFFELVTGQPPFVGRNDKETLRQIIAESVSVNALQKRQVPRDLQAVCLKCLEKDPSKRYESAAALASDLRRFLNGEAVAARPCGRTERVILWCKRRPLQAALCTVLCFVSFAGVAGISWQWNRAEHHLAATRSLLYAANIQLAGAAWEQRNVRAVNALLDSFDPKLNSQHDTRGWEWYYFHRLCHQDLATLHLGESIECIGESTIAQTVYVGSKNGKIAAIDVRHRKIAWVIDAFDEKVIALGASPDGKRLAAVDRIGHIRVWKTDLIPQLIDQKTLNHGEIMAAGFDADLDRLAIGDRDLRIHIFGLEPMKSIATCEGHTATVKSLVFSSNKNELLSSSEDGSVRLWSIDSSRQKYAAFHPDRRWLIHAALSHDGRWIAAGSQDGKLMAWEVGSKKPAFSQQAHSDVVNFLCFSTQDDCLTTASGDRSVSLWSFPKIQLLKTFWGHENATSSAAAVSDELLISVGRDGAFKFWDRRQDSMDNPAPLSANVGGVVFGSDGQMLAKRFQDGTVVIDQWPEMHEAYRFAGPPGLDTLAYNGDHRLCAVSREDGAIEIWEGRNRIHELQFHTLPSKSLSLSRDAQWLVAGNADGTVSLWDPRTGVLKHHTGVLNDHIVDQEREVRCVAFHPYRRSLVALAGDCVNIIDAETGKIRRTLVSHKDKVYCAAFNADGALLAVGDKTGDIIIWDVETLVPRTTLSGHTDRVFGCCFTPTGHRLVSCGRDGTIRWWDVETKREVCVLRGDWGAQESLALSPDGWSLLSVSESNNLRLWNPRRTAAPAFAQPERSRQR
jgi:WD40 repeat protein